MYTASVIYGWYLAGVRNKGMVIKYEAQRYLLDNELTRTEEMVIQRYEVCLLFIV